MKIPLKVNRRKYKQREKKKPSFKPIYKFIRMDRNLPNFNKEDFF